MAARIEDYALLGDGRSAALVARDGSIDWLCWPTLSSEAIFAALLGETVNGCWRISLRGEHTTVARRYLPATLVLETRMAGDEGEIILLDWMAWHADPPLLLRRVRCTRGRVRLDFRLDVCRNYGQFAAPRTSTDDGGHRAWLLAEHTVWLEGAADLQDGDGAVQGEFLLTAGAQRDFVLGCHPSRSSAAVTTDATDASAVLHDTVQAWERWHAKGHADGPYGAAIRQSLLALKALTSIHSGGLAAAATSSLPEVPGGARNWDYRFCWLRDASFTMLALVRSGYQDEAVAWRDWLVGAISRHPSQQRVLYDISGEPTMKEWECPWLPGYENSRPVRFGNDAAGQLQLDTRGEVLNALYLSRRHGLAPDPAAWALEKRLVDHIAEVWCEPDNGFWEIRGERRHFTTSKVLLWAAVDRAMRSAREYGHEAPLDAWQAVADRIHGDVLDHGMDPQRKFFTSSYGSTDLDASLLMIPLSGFLPIDDPRIGATIRAVETRLMKHGLLYRYRPAAFQDGLSDADNAFIACSLWLVQVRAMQGRASEAKELFERVLALRNDLGLLAEEYDPERRRMYGNFPQALSHVALINAALALQEEGEPGK
jgi:GH15 family glucan-1,4-alpha-glucosidase